MTSKLTVYLNNHVAGRFEQAASQKGSTPTEGYDEIIRVWTIRLPQVYEHIDTLTTFGSSREDQQSYTPKRLQLQTNRKRRFQQKLRRVEADTAASHHRREVHTALAADMLWLHCQD